MNSWLLAQMTCYAGKIFLFVKETNTCDIRRKWDQIIVKYHNKLPNNDFSHEFIFVHCKKKKIYKKKLKKTIFPQKFVTKKWLNSAVKKIP